MTQNTRTALERIEDLEHAKDYAESEYLRKFGWKATSSTPDVIAHVNALRAA